MTSCGIWIKRSSRARVELKAESQTLSRERTTDVC
jgi:hypothetical protein